MRVHILSALRVPHPLPCFSPLMDEPQCYAGITALLSEGALPLSKWFTVVLGSKAPELTGQPNAAPANRNTPPILHISCMKSTDDTGVQMDGLGSSRQLRAKGYFQGSTRSGDSSISTTQPSGPCGTITLLYDRLTATDMAPLLRHELVHAMDHAVHGLDMTTCAGLACSEVRASAAGECAPSQGHWFPGRCISATSSTSTAMVFPNEGAYCARAVFSKCSSLPPEVSPVPYVVSLLEGEAAARDVGQPFTS